MMSEAQVELFKLYGDTLILDWTHNTNNMGFYLGSLMITSASGHGVSVCDFLCVEQTEAMMSLVFEYFINVNPTAIDAVKPFVIDKDYKEWRVLERLFVKSAVLLCQFHVAKWFAYVVTMRKYNLTKLLRERVEATLSDMIYAVTTIDFDVLVANLRRLLGNVCPAFLEYMESRWYNCRRMWSNCERSAVFTALNTTTNRIESSWNQIKRFLGRKLRIDLCVEAVFAYQTAVLRRETRIISSYENSLVLRAEVDRFMRAAMAAVCDYACEKVGEQWTSFRAHDDDSGDPYACWKHDDSFFVTRGGADTAVYTVHDSLTRCSCGFAVASALPCRHMIYVARRVNKLSQFPVEAVRARWVLKGAFASLPLLDKCTREIQTLRTSLLLSDSELSRIIDQDSVKTSNSQPKTHGRIAYRRLKRSECSDAVVLGDIEKRNIVERAMGETITLLVSQSPANFLHLSVQLKDLLSKFVENSRKALELGRYVDGRVGQTLGEPQVVPGAGSAPQASAHDNPLPTTFPPTVTSNPTFEAVVAVRDEQPGVESHDAVVVATCDPDLAVTPKQFHLPTTSSPTLEAFMVEALQEYQDLDLPLSPGGPVWRVLSPPRAMLPAMQKVAPPAPSTPRAPPPQTQPPCDAQSPSHSTQSTVSSAAISALLNPIVEHEARTTRGSMDLKLTAAAMRRLGARTLTHDSISSKQTTSKSPQVTKTDRDWLRSLVGSDYESDDFDDAVSGGLEKCTLSRRVPKGRTKRQKTSGTTGARYEYIEQDSPCTVDIHALCVALLHTTNLERVAEILEKYPRRLDESSLAAMSPEASMEVALGGDFVVRFRIKRRLLSAMRTALLKLLPTRRLYGGEDRVDLSALDPAGLIDLNGSLSQRPPEPANQAVVRLCSQVRPFSKNNIVDFQTFFTIKDMCKSYRADMLWLEKHVHGAFEIPYLREALTHRCVVGDLLTSARTSIRAVLSSCTASTSFGVRTQRQDLCMTITILQVMDYLARSAELNDCVLMYALRQLASDYSDVYIIDSLDSTSPSAGVPLSHARCVIFPRNVGRVHWCIVVVELAHGVVRSVTLYDPLQGLYETTLGTFWKTHGLAYLSKWSRLDGQHPLCGLDVTPQVLRVQPQHDGSSCGVYCIAIAVDLASGSHFFHDRLRCPSGWSGAPNDQRQDRELTMTHLRALLMWRILCDSSRTDHEEEEHDAREKIAIVESFEENKKTKVLARKGFKKSARHATAWRE